MARRSATSVGDESMLDAGVRRLLSPHVYHVSLSERLWELKHELVAEARST